MSDETKVRPDIDDGVATVTFDRPRVKNSLDVEALEQFFAALGTCEDRDLADGPTHLQGYVKETFHDGWNRSLEECTEHECMNLLKSLDDPYAAERLGAFLRGERTNSISVRLP